jgi:predicted RNA-binding Zn-ribbon protein involved in translation (DUF1610 family)
MSTVIICSECGKEIDRTPEGETEIISLCDRCRKIVRMYEAPSGFSALKPGPQKEYTIRQERLRAFRKEKSA